MNDMIPDLEKFRKLLKDYPLYSEVIIPDAPTKSHKRYLFTKNMKIVLEKYEKIFAIQADSWCENFCKSEKIDYLDYRSQLTCIIRMFFKRF